MFTIVMSGFGKGSPDREHASLIARKMDSDSVSGDLELQPMKLDPEGPAEKVR